MTFVLGGARSGKSRYSVELCRDVEQVVFIATARAEDDEMAARIARHRAERPSHWTTIEAPIALEAALEKADAQAKLLIDCMTLWISNLMYEYRELARADRERAILEAVERVIDQAGERENDVVIVSNEVGHGLVPETSVGREFRDLVGTANQHLAQKAERVVFLVAGLPIVLK